MSVCTGQHRDLVEPILEFFEIAPDIELDVMRPDQSLAELTDAAPGQLERRTGRPSGRSSFWPRETRPAVLATALASFYQKIPFGHVEAGLRTRQPSRPVSRGSQPGDRRGI